MLAAMTDERDLVVATSSYLDHLFCHVCRAQ